MTTQSTIDKLIEMRRMHGTHRRAETSGGVGILRFAQDVPAVIVSIRPRLPNCLTVLAHELVEAVVGIGRRALTVGDGRDVPARVVGIGIRRRAGFPRSDLPRGRCGRGIVVADRGLDHGLSAILRVHRGHPPQRVVGVARGDGSLRRFRQAVVRSGAKRSFDHILHQNGHLPAFTLAAQTNKTALFPLGSAGRNTAPERDAPSPNPVRQHRVRVLSPEWCCTATAHLASIEPMRHMSECRRTPPICSFSAFSRARWLLCRFHQCRIPWKRVHSQIVGVN